MQRVRLFLFIVVIGAVALISTIGTFLPHQMMMLGGGGGMGQMMGTRFGMGSFLWPTVLTFSTTVVMIVAAYVVLFPTIRYDEESETKQQSSTLSAFHAMDIVMRTVKPDERVALEVLRNSGGACLQKDITYKTGLSKLKTHRIVARLAERGIIQVKKIGKTNEIRMPSWLGSSESTDKADMSQA
jgi:predicted transcriptional regulator